MAGESPATLFEELVLFVFLIVPAWKQRGPTKRTNQKASRAEPEEPAQRTPQLRQKIQEDQNIAAINEKEIGTKDEEKAHQNRSKMKSAVANSDLQTVKMGASGIGEYRGAAVVLRDTKCSLLRNPLHLVE
jgi:hypothetical protein